MFRYMKITPLHLRKPSLVFSSAFNLQSPAFNRIHGRPDHFCPLRLFIMPSVHEDLTFWTYLSQKEKSERSYSRFLLKTADTVLTIPIIPATPFLTPLVPFMSSCSPRKTCRTPWYASAAETSKKPQSAESASCRPSSLETTRRCCRSRLLPTTTMGTEVLEEEDSFWISANCCWTTSKLAWSQMLYTSTMPSAQRSCSSVTDSELSQL